jgi:hypothetical protein
LVFLCALAGQGSCTETNPGYVSGEPHDAPMTADVTRLPDAAPDVRVDVDGPGPPDRPVDRPVPGDAAADAMAAPVDAGIDARADIAVDTGAAGTADVAPRPTLMLDKGVYSVGEAIVTTFANGPGLTSDWIGIYDENAPTPSDDSRSLLWYFTDNRGWDTRAPAPGGPKSGTVTFGPGSRGSRQWPLPAARYKAIFISDPYVLLTAPVHFQVR